MDLPSFEFGLSIFNFWGLIPKKNAKKQPTAFEKQLNVD